MKKIALLTPCDAEFGFGLAGMSQCVAKQEEAEDKLKEIISESDTGLVIIDERMMKGIEEGEIRKAEERWSGIIVVLPSPIKPSAEVEDYAVRLIRRAIGYHVRLKL